MTRYNEYKANIWKSYLFRFLRNFHLIGGVLIPFFMIWGGITFFQVMILQAFFTFSMFALEVPTGVVADFLGRKTSLAMGAFVGATGAFIYSLVPSFWLFMFAEFLFAVGGTLVSGADQAMIYDSLKEIKHEKKSKIVFGRWNSLSLVALAIAAPIGSILGKTIGLEWPMRLLTIPLILAGFLAFTLKEPSKELKHKKKKYLEILKEGTRYFKNHKELKILAFDYATISVLAFFLIWVYQIILQSLEFPLAYFGFVHAAILIGEILVLNTFAHLEKFVGGKKNYLFISALIVGIGFLVLASFQNAYIVIPAIVLIASFILFAYII